MRSTTVSGLEGAVHEQPGGDGAGGALPSVAVVIPAHRSSPAFRRCLEAVAALDPPPAELIVVVDGGDERIVEEATAAGARVIVQRPQAGPAVARNVGAARVSSDIVLFLDSDVAAAPDVVAKVAREFAAQPDVAAVIGSYDDDPPPYNLSSMYMNLRHHFVHQRARSEGSTFWGACGAMRRQAFEQLGGFDEEYVAPSIEDIELGYRLKAAGGRVRVVKDLRVKHLKRWDLGPMLKTDLVFRALPWSALILRTRRLENDLNISVGERVKSVLMLLALAATDDAVVWPLALIVVIAAVGVVLAANWSFLALLARRGGLRLALFGALWHLAYHLYTVGAFVTAAARHVVFGAQPAQQPWPGSPRRWTSRAEPPVVDARPPPDDPRPPPSIEPSGAVEVVHVAHRVAQSSPLVATERLLRQSRRVRWWVPLALLASLGVILLPLHRDAVGVDGLAYIRIAQNYADGELQRAINGHWGPLYSWLLAPLLALGIEPLLATKLLQLAIGAAVLVAVRRLCVRCVVRIATADGMTLITVPLVLHLALTEVYAELLLALLLLLFAGQLLPGEDQKIGAGAAWAGVWGGLAFLAKPYALPIVVASAFAASVVAGWLARRRGDPAGMRGYLRRAAVVVATTALVVAPWLIVLSVHLGEPTVTQAWTYNSAILAPESTGQPMADGLVEPPYEGALFAWEDPSTIAVETEGWSPSAESGRRLVSNVMENVREGSGFVAQRFAVVPVFALVGAIVLLRRRRLDPPRLRSAWPAVAVTVTVYAAGYLVTVVEQHYLWFVVLALVPLAAIAVELPLLRPSLARVDPRYALWRFIGFALLAIGVAGEAAFSLPQERPGSEVAATAREVEESVPQVAARLAGARVASSDDWEGSSVLCFHLGCTYLGVAEPDAAGLAAARERADFYVLWADDVSGAGGGGGILFGSPALARVEELQVFSTDP